MHKIWNFIKEKQIIKRYFILIICLFVAALNFNLFMNPLKLVVGGTNGLAILGEKLFSFKPSMFMLVFSIITLILGWIFLGTNIASSALIATFLYPVFVDLTSDFGNFITIDLADVLLISIFSGVIAGFVSGHICKVGLSQGGILLINQILASKFKWSLSKLNFIFNGFIVISGGLVFGMNNVLYAFIVLYLSSVMMNRVMLGISQKKVFYIITEKENEIRSYIINVMGCGVTKFGTSSNKKYENKDMLMAVIPNDKYYDVKKQLKKLDKKLFLVIADSYESYGEN